jgi:hypothetical protein
MNPPNNHTPIRAINCFYCNGCKASRQPVFVSSVLDFRPPLWTDIRVFSVGRDVFAPRRFL